jgi:DNA-binding Lrp family transcriptional regulator
MMTMNIGERQRKIYTLLQKKIILSIPEIVDQFQISIMTAHRDVERLVEQGLVEKFHGGVRLTSQGVRANQIEDCAHCQKKISPRTAFVIHLNDHIQVQTCCPHCGLLHMSLYPSIVSAMTPDFIYGRAVNVKNATFLVESAILLCCTPTILCLDQADDAIRLQKGFGGQVLNFSEALEFVRQDMRVELGAT